MGNEKDRKPFQKWILVGAAALLMVVLLVVWLRNDSSGDMNRYLWYKGQESQVDKDAQRKQEFVIGGSDIPADPRICQQNGLTARQISHLVYEPLVSVSGDKEVQPVLAKTVTFSEDGLTAEVTLENRTFSDGAPVTAEDVLESYRMLNEPVSQNPLKPVMTAIEGMDDFQSGATDTFGVEVLAADKVRFRFHSVSVNNLEALSAPIVKKSDGELFALGSGGYQLEGMQGMEEVRLVKNPKGNSHLPYERIRFVNATRQRIEQSLEDCSIDAVQINANELAAQVQEAGCYDIYTLPTENRSYLCFAPEASLTVRQTVNAVFDSDSFCKEMDNIMGTDVAYVSGGGLVSPTYTGSTDFGNGKRTKQLAKALEKERGEAVLYVLLDGTTLSRSRFQILVEQFDESGIRLDAVYAEEAGAPYDFAFSMAESRTPEQLIFDGSSEEMQQTIANQLSRDYRKTYEVLEQQAGRVLPVVPVGAEAAHWAVLSDCRNADVIALLMG